MKIRSLIFAVTSLKLEEILRKPATLVAGGCHIIKRYAIYDKQSILIEKIIEKENEKYIEKKEHERKLF